MRLRIRTKFIGILIVASVLPLIIALVTAQLLGYRYYRAAQGNLFRTMAEYLAGSLSLAINKQLEDLDEWITLSDLYVLIEKTPVLSGHGVPADANLRTEWIESKWSTLGADSPQIKALVDNSLARRLKAFRVINPLFAELLITNGTGELIAATGKTSDYWQADEEWWQRAASMPAQTPQVDGIKYDESARVYSIDVDLPIYDPNRPGKKPVAIIKGVIDATPLFRSLEAANPADTAIRQVVLSSGQILVRLSGKHVLPMNEQVLPSAIRTIRTATSGWTITELSAAEVALAGFAPLKLTSPARGSTSESEVPAMFVVVYNPVSTALNPVRRQMHIVGGIGIVLVLGFALMGYVIAGKKIIDPIERLRSAVQSVAASAKLTPSGAAPTSALAGIGHKYPALDRIRTVRTGDELESLAGDFASMAQKVVGYHEELEAEIATKTEEIQRDLQLAREFQEALMPRVYPQIPAPAANDALTLHFHHIYRPASSVGGDFFDVLKLSDHSAGVFIADVMGHGARSALVTAILRTLLQDFADKTDDPAEFLRLINAHFHKIISQSDEFLFVSAFYLVLNTQTALATYAAAGHPSPFFADRTRGRVDPLMDDLRNNPALGLFPGSRYEKWTKSVIPGDIFVLFTDGLHEAASPEGEDYGFDRLRKTIVDHIGCGASDLNTAILADLDDFLGETPLSDDLCLVTVEVGSASIQPPPHAHPREQATV